MRMTYKPRKLVYGQRCLYCGSTQHMLGTAYKSSCVMKVTRQWVYCRGRALIADLDRATDMLVLAIEYMVVNNIVTKDEQLHKLRSGYLARRNIFSPDPVKATSDICMNIIIISRILRENLPQLANDLSVLAYVRESALAICYGRAARNMYEMAHMAIKKLDGFPRGNLRNSNAYSIRQRAKREKMLEDRGWFKEMRAVDRDATT